MKRNHTQRLDIYNVMSCSDEWMNTFIKVLPS